MTAVNRKLDRGQIKPHTSRMPPAVQQRTLKTRARLIETAEAVIAQHGFEALRVDQVVKSAGVAKGTFFAHFKDKDALMDMLIGGRIDHFLDQVEALAAPQTISELTDMLLPLMRFMQSERYVFDVILRYSGAAAEEHIGPIAMTFRRQIEVLSPKLAASPFRKDISADMAAEGVQAFMINAVALQFCALQGKTPLASNFSQYLEAWLIPQHG